MPGAVFPAEGSRTGTVLDMLMAAELQAFARDHGIHAVGWFPASDFDLYLATLRSRPEYRQIAYRPWTVFEKAGHIPMDTRTVIVLVMDYFVEPNEPTDGFRLSNYVRACWNTISPGTAALAQFLQAHGCRADNLDVPQRAAACRAGLGHIGRNAMFYAHGIGSYVGIASLGTDAVLEGPAPAPERVSHPRCETCGRCVAACPVGAIPPAGYAIDPLRCLSMLNRHPDEPRRILPQRPEQLGGWVCGCETCQDVCPLNAETHHARQAVVAPEVRIEGLTLPNTAVVARETLEAGLASIRSSGYAQHVRFLLSQSGKPSDAAGNARHRHEFRDACKTAQQHPPMAATSCRRLNA